MIGVGSFFSVSDNSGAIIVQCIRSQRLKFDISSGSKVGDFLTVVVKKSYVPETVKKRKFAKKSDIFLAVIVNSMNGLSRFSSSSKLNFFNNFVVLVKKDDIFNPFATRISTSVPSELKTYGFSKLIILSNDIF